MYYYEVAPRKIVRQDSNVLTYHSDTKLPVGAIVRITIGKTEYSGLVIRSVKKPSYETKSIIDTIESNPLPTQLIETAQWISAYYHTHLATVLQTILPAKLTTKRRKKADQSAQLVNENRTHFLLNKTQSATVESILKHPSGTTLLKGITGSGKTAVYVELAAKAIEENRSAIIIVPEIALTSQLVSVFSGHFPNIIITHSKMTEAERHLAWKSALNTTEPCIVIGPRSALFMPLPDIGLIVIDEAHEPSLKQEQSPRYHASRVASVLAKKHKARVVLGSATPPITDYYLASHQERSVLRMDTTARQSQKPEVILVDMTKKDKFKRHRFLSDVLVQEITKTLASNKQVLIFHNRRGTTPSTVCSECGWTASCSNCFLPMTLHADKHHLRCHVCGYTDKVPTSCPECGGADIIHKGIGTKLIESELKKLFANANIKRFDGDSNQQDTVDKLYDQIRDGKIDIIIGTQIIAKGLDLPNLRTVGVVQADAGLSLPDFSSAERTFQLVSQVIGRIGRDNHSTTAVIQSYQPTHPAISLGIKQNFEAFYDLELAERKRSQFPPFTHLLKLTCIYKTEAAAVRNARSVMSDLRAVASPDVEILGPSPSFYERVGDTYRWQIIIKSPKRAELVDLLDKVPTSHWQAELDPMSII